MVLGNADSPATTANTGTTSNIASRVDRSFFYVFPALFLLYCAPGLVIAFVAIGAPWVASADVSKAFQVLSDLDLEIIPAVGGIILLPISTYYSVSQRGSEASHGKSVGIFYFFFIMFVLSGALYLYFAYFNEAIHSYDLPDPADPSKILMDAAATAEEIARTYVKEFLLYALTVLGANTAFDAFVNRQR